MKPAVIGLLEHLNKLRDALQGRLAELEAHAETMVANQKHAADHLAQFEGFMEQSAAAAKAVSAKKDAE